MNTLFKRVSLGASLARVLQLTPLKADETGALFGLAAVPIKNVSFAATSLNVKLRKIQVEYYRSIGLTERGEGKMPAPTGDFYIHLMSREPQLY